MSDRDRRELGDWDGSKGLIAGVLIIGLIVLVAMLLAESQGSPL